VTRYAAPVILSCDDGFPLVRDGVVDVLPDGRLGYVGPAALAPVTDEPVHECSGLLMPGMVNTHCHTPMAPLRGLGGDLPLLSWLQDVMWPAEAQLTADDVRVAMTAGGVELLRSGCTTSVEMYFQTDAILSAVDAVGSRVVLTPGIIDAPGWDRLGTWERMRDEISARIDAVGVVSGEHARVELGYGPHSAYTLSPSALESIAAAAQERGALMHVHVAESAQEDVVVRESHGSVPAMLDSIGALSGRVLAAHSIQLSAADVSLFAARGVAVAHCPGSNAKLAAGVAPVGSLRAAGVRVGLGTDGPASGDDLDLWHQARLAALFARIREDDAAALTAADVLLMATREGAAAIDRADIGVLAAGRWADMVHVDLEDQVFVDPSDDAQLLSNLVWAGGARLVTDVWVAGRQVIEEGEPLLVDAARTRSDLRTLASRLH
jgi:5-methylthioadenosine/S-adenosylhomocysteine deaminase